MDPSALGRYLRESREAKELTLEDAVRSLRIRRDILEAFEQGEFNIMDSTVRVRGMLRNYARFLGLEEDRVLQYYESANDRIRRRRNSRRQIHAEPIAPRRITDTPPALPAVQLAAGRNATDRVVDLLRILAMILVSIAAIAVISFVIIDRLEMLPDESAIVSAPTIVPGSLSATPTNTATITPRATIITDTPAPALSVVGVQVEVEMSQRSWVSVSVDGRELYMGFLDPGFSESYTGNENVTLRAANAAALDVTYNGISQDSFGARGQEVEIIFSTTGVEVMQNTVQAVEPTPTNPVASTPTPLIAITPTIQAEAINVQPTTIPTSLGPSPTPLFQVNQPTQAPTERPSGVVADEQAQTQPTQTTAPQTNPDAQNAPPTATEAANDGAILPLRATPSNPTPTKTG